MPLVRRVRQLLMVRRGTPRGSSPGDIPVTTLESMFAYQDERSRSVPGKRRGARRASA
jgi:hypothetical protein